MKKSTFVSALIVFSSLLTLMTFNAFGADIITDPPSERKSWNDRFVQHEKELDNICKNVEDIRDTVIDTEEQIAGDILCACKITKEYAHTIPFTLAIYNHVKNKADRSGVRSSIKDYYQYASDILSAHQKYIVALAKISRKKELLSASEKLIKKIADVREDINKIKLQ